MIFLTTIMRKIGLLSEHSDGIAADTPIVQTKHHALPCPLCGDPNPNRHCCSPELVEQTLREQGRLWE